MKRILIAALVALAATACKGGAKPAADRPQPPPPEAISKTTENGPVKATVKVWPTAPALGDPLHLELTIEAAPGVTVAAPFEDEGLGRFHAIGWTHDTRRRDDGGTIETQRYELEAPGSGKHRIPPFRLLITDARTAGSGAPPAPTELLTDEIPLAVAPVDPARAGEKLAPPRGALPLRIGGWPKWLFAVLAVFVLGFIAGAIVLVRQLRTRAAVRARITAYELAVSRLAKLEQGGAPDEAGLDGWFVELSSIIRHYLEHRYAVRAPELTTEEFLQVARRAPGLSAEHRELLTAFLERCDRVKFAGYRPDADESMATLKAARAFVEDTRLREVAA